jgi:hypothetical protein
MSDADDALAHTWSLNEEGRDDELAGAIEPVLPLLIDAGYVEADDSRWRFTQAGVVRAHELSRRTSDEPWPFEGGFPRHLGVRVMRSILDAEAPVLQVVHAREDWWGFADGVDSPNGDASSTVHVHHVLELDQSLEELATLPPGSQADREGRVAVDDLGVFIRRGLSKATARVAACRPGPAPR